MLGGRARFSASRAVATPVARRRARAAAARETDHEGRRDGRDDDE
jgi:hypothetical protein